MLISNKQIETFETGLGKLSQLKKLCLDFRKKQFEQNANARILEQMGVTTCKELNVECIEKWLNSPNTVQVKFDDDLQNIVNAILKTPLHRRGNRLAA